MTLSPRRIGFIAMTLALVFDQLSKRFFMDLLTNPPREIEILPFFKLTPVWNRGVSFGMFQAETPWHSYGLVALAVLIIAYVLYWFWREESRLNALALGLIIGGAVGNVIDRLEFGAVRDFFYFHLESFAWPAFNIADSCIVIGVGLLIFESMLLGRHQKAMPKGQ